MVSASTDSNSATSHGQFGLPIIVSVKNLTVLTVGSGDIGYITLPAGLTRWTLMAARTDAASAMVVSETASGTLAAMNLGLFTAANAGGTQILSYATLSALTAAGHMQQLATSTSLQTGNTIYFHQTSDSAYAGTISIYLLIMPLP
jgi:hypothetical protein